MKKYVKPEIVFESFALTTNIAAGCEQSTNFSAGSCAIYDAVFGNIFTEAASYVCDTPVPDGFNDICYHNPTDGNNVFVS